MALTDGGVRCRCTVFTKYTGHRKTAIVSLELGTVHALHFIKTKPVQVETASRVPSLVLVEWFWLNDLLGHAERQSAWARIAHSVSRALYAPAASNQAGLGGIWQQLCGFFGAGLRAHGAAHDRAVGDAHGSADCNTDCFSHFNAHSRAHLQTHTQSHTPTDL